MSRHSSRQAGIAHQQDMSQVMHIFGFMAVLAVHNHKHFEIIHWSIAASVTSRSAAAAAAILATVLFLV